MAEIFRLPAVSPTMEIGTLVEWRLSEGQAFTSGDIVCEVGTDKATVEAEIYDDGVMLKHLVSDDDEVPVNAPIAIIGAEGEDIAALVDTALAELASMREAAEDGGEAEAPPAEQAPAAEAPEPATPAPAPKKASKPLPTPASVKRSWAGKELSSLFLDTPGDVRAATVTAKVLASPLARAVADDLGVDLRRVKGSGPGGRITKSDVENAPASGGGIGPALPPRSDETLKLTPMRKVIAKRLLASHQDIPTFFLTATFDVSGFVALRAQLKKAEPDLKVSYNDMLLACVARALRAFPRANASWTKTGIVLHGRVDLGMAVAVDEGLLTPVLRGADTLSIPEIARQTRELAGQAREGTLLPEQYQGGTFTVSNLGMFGIDHFTAIINPPEAGILAVGALQEVPVVNNGAVSTGWRMKVTMTCDHRVIDGAIGAQFLQVLRRYVEAPALLLF